MGVFLFEIYIREASSHAVKIRPNESIVWKFF